MSNSLTVRATVDAILAAGGSSVARTGMHTAYPGGVMTPDPFARPTPVDQGWDVTGSAACLVAVAMHADPRGRSLFWRIAAFASPQSSVAVSLEVTEGAGVDGLDDTLAGPYATAEAFAAAVAVEWNTAASPAASPRVAVATSWGLPDGSAWLQLRALRVGAALASSDEVARMELTNTVYGNDLGQPAIVYREAQPDEDVTLRIWALSDVEYGPLWRAEGAFAAGSDAWTKAAPTLAIDHDGRVQRISISSIRAVWPQVTCPDTESLAGVAGTVRRIVYVMVAPAIEDAS